MDDLVLARHGESETSVCGVVGGDAPLTERGREQAVVLREELARLPFDVCVTSGARRALETAEIALAGRSVPREVLPALGDIDFGRLDGRSLLEYRAWIARHSPADSPDGGESRVATLRRFCGAYRMLLDRPQSHVLVVGHGLTLAALTDAKPRTVVAGVPYGSWIRLTRAELEAAVTRLERWCEAPAW
jgi:broad specificity phosphatase PhoE